MRRLPSAGAALALTAMTQPRPSCWRWAHGPSSLRWRGKSCWRRRSENHLSNERAARRFWTTDPLMPPTHVEETNLGLWHLLHLRAYGRPLG